MPAPTWPPPPPVLGWFASRRAPSAPPAHGARRAAGPRGASRRAGRPARRTFPPRPPHRPCDGPATTCQPVRRRTSPAAPVGGGPPPAATSGTSTRTSSRPVDPPGRRRSPRACPRPVGPAPEPGRQVLPSGEPPGERRVSDREGGVRRHRVAAVDHEPGTGEHGHPADQHDVGIVVVADVDVAQERVVSGRGRSAGDTGAGVAAARGQRQGEQAGGAAVRHHGGRAQARQQRGAAPVMVGVDHRREAESGIQVDAAADARPPAAPQQPTKGRSADAQWSALRCGDHPALGGGERPHPAVEPKELAAERQRSASHPPKPAE